MTLMRILDDFPSRAVSGARWPAGAPGESYRAVLVVVVLVINEREKTVTFSYDFVSLHINHFSKNDLMRILDDFPSRGCFGSEVVCSSSRGAIEIEPLTCIRFVRGKSSRLLDYTY